MLGAPRPRVSSRQQAVEAAPRSRGRRRRQQRERRGGLGGAGRPRGRSCAVRRSIVMISGWVISLDRLQDQHDVVAERLDVVLRSNDGDDLVDDTEAARREPERSRAARVRPDGRAERPAASPAWRRHELVEPSCDILGDSSSWAALASEPRRAGRSSSPLEHRACPAVVASRRHLLVLPAGRAARGRGEQDVPVGPLEHHLAPVVRLGLLEQGRGRWAAGTAALVS
jgi:hypothetical protein